MKVPVVRLSLLAAVVVVPLMAATQTADSTPKYAFAEPGISPDGREIAFTSGGDIWSVPAGGGDAHLLVADAGNDRRPLFSPDGKALAFISSRTGGGDIYLLTLASGAIQRLTWDDGLEQLEGWSRDSQWIYFSSTSRDIAGMNDIYRVRREGGTPMVVSGDRYVNEFQPAASPDGKRLVFAARGVGSSQWWRISGSHLDESELWTVDLAALDGDEPASAYKELTPRDSRQLWPMWNADGSALFYVGDRGGPENIWTRPAAPGGGDKAVTTFKNGRVLFPSITTDGKTIAFEKDFGIWTLDTSTGAAHPIAIVRRGAVSAPAPERVRQTNQFSALALSPDGKKVAFLAHGDVFAASAKDGGDATRVTATPDLETQPVWAPDSRKLAYVSARNGGAQVYLYEFATSTETPITTGNATDLSPVFSPDGKQIAYLRDRKELHAIDLATKADRVLATAVFADTIDDPRPVWSPDGAWIAAFVIGAKAFTNVALISTTAAGPPHPVSYLANYNADSIAYSHDGTYVLYTTGQRTEPGQLARVDLTPKTPKFREDLFRDLFTPEMPRKPGDPGKPSTEPAPADPAKTLDTKPAETKPADTKPGDAKPDAPATPAKPVTPVFPGIRDRLSLLPLGLDVSSVVISPDGKTAAVIASAAGQTSLYSYSLDDLSETRPVARQLTTTPGGKSSPQFTPDGKEIYFLDAGRISIANVDRRDARALNVTAEYTSDFAVDKMTIFEQAWTLMRDNFFDAHFNGVNWESSRETYGERVAAASTPDELRRLLSFMVGDLNSSHLGVTAPAGGAATIGRLGLRFDRRAFEARGELRVTQVIPLGPAALTTSLKPGDVIVSVNGQPIGPHVSLEERLANTIDKRVVLGVESAAGGAARDVIVRPINQATEKGLIYREWVDRNREYVLKGSGGRLGYVHMLNMSQAALDQLQIDLDADNQARDGVVIDIRNNSGGFVNAYAIDVFTRQPYLRMSTRGVPEAPARTILGQRALELPTVLITNQHSLSDAEDFTEGYRTLKLGTVVGEPTAGWIVYTWDTRLLDGTTFRLPRMRVKGADGTDMERHPRQVDDAVTNPVGETLTDRDAQLDEAIRVLLKRLGKAE